MVGLHIADSLYSMIAMGMGNSLVREGRRRKGITQAQLAALAGTTQSAIARLEAGRANPSFDSVLRILRLMDLDLDLMLVDRVDDDWWLARDNLSRTVPEQVQHHAEFRAAADQFRAAGNLATMTFDPLGMLDTLNRHGVRYVLIGGYGATFHASPFLTSDIDITPARSVENLERLSAALTELNARIRTASEPAGVPFGHTGASLAQAEVWTLQTDLGALDIAFEPAGTEGFDDLIRDAQSREVANVVIPVASLADIIRSKQVANRDKDRRVLPTLRELLKAQEEI